jgi:5'(3')-deoxyribonucleotidase
MTEKKAIVYVDMDHVLCDYATGFARHKAEYPNLAFPQSVPGLYESLDPMPDAIESYMWLHEHSKLDVYILTAPSIKNPHCYAEKRIWVEQHLGMEVVENLIISPHKHLNKGDYLIDDMPSGKGQDYFKGQLVLFGSLEFPNWRSVITYFKSQIKR